MKIKLISTDFAKLLELVILLEIQIIVGYSLITWSVRPNHP